MLWFCFCFIFVFFLFLSWTCKFSILEPDESTSVWVHYQYYLFCMGVWQLDMSCTSSLSSSLTNTYLVKHQKIGSKLINSWEYHHFSFPNHVHDSSIHHFEVFVLSNSGRKCTGFIQGKLSYQPIHVTALANLTYENCWALWTCSFEENYTNSLKNTLWLKWGLFNTKWKRSLFLCKRLPFYMATWGL